MNRPTIRSAFLHAKYGSGIILLVFDLVMLAFLVGDIAEVRSLDLSYHALMRSASLEALGFAPFLSFLVLLFLPIFLAFLGNFFLFRYAPDRYYRHTTDSMTKSRFLLFHTLVVTLCIAHSTLIGRIQRASGLCGPLASHGYCFNSRFSFLESLRPYLIVSTILLPIVSLVIKDTLYKGRELAREFDFWRLIGAVGEYQPAYGDEIIYVNSASMAPSIRSINTVMTAYHQKYQRAVPTSDSARRFLLEKANHARVLLYHYLLNNDEKLTKLLNIEFFPGTSRALEAGILRIGNITHIILSQYEHPSQVDVVRWLCETQRTITYTPLLPQSPAFFQEQWEQQKVRVCEAIEGILAEKPEGRVAIVLSEVHYITGIHVRVSEIMEELRSRHDNLVFIIDGSQAVGNLTQPLGRFANKFLQDDFYYFSAHKWLLSPNTCGVLISYVKNSQLQPYDMFGFNLPTSTIDPNTIFGLSAALEFLFDDRGLFGRFLDVSRGSKEYFKILTGRPESRLEIVESVTSELNSSLFIAVKPKFGYRWKCNHLVFWEHMRKRGVDLTVIPEKEPYFESEESDEVKGIDAYLLRVSFPYYLIGRNVKNLMGHLNALISEAN